MTSGEPVVSAHSVAEAFLYLMAKSCHRCGTGPLKPSGELTKTERAEAPWRLTGRCPKCSSEATFHFVITPVPTREDAKLGVINSTNDASRAIDLLGWLTLFQSILNSAADLSDKETARQLTIEATMCLDEAMKFYGPGEELPGPEAFFNSLSRQRYLDHPQQFAKSVWLDRRRKLPVARSSEPPAPRKRRWWPFGS